LPDDLTWLVASTSSQFPFHWGWSLDRAALSIFQNCLLWFCAIKIFSDGMVSFLCHSRTRSWLNP
jgi:hypothetical protein